LWLPRALQALSVLILIGASLRAANPIQRNTILARYDAEMSEGRKARSQGQFVRAIRYFEQAAGLANAARDDARQAESLVSVSASQIRLFQYSAALRSATAARVSAIGAHSAKWEGAAANNLSTVYSQLGDWESASKEAEEAVACLKASSNEAYLARALLNQADIEADRAIGIGAAGKSNFARTKALYDQGIAAARKARQPGLEATIRDDLGISLLLAGDTSSAEQPLRTAYSLATEAHDQELIPFIKEHLAELALRRKQYDSALKLVDEAFSSASLSFKTTPQYYPLHVRGEILLALNRKTEALSQFRKAVHSANDWRQGALPGDVTNTRTVVTLHAVYLDFAQLAAKLSLETHNPALAEEALGALADNRGASLREQIASDLSRDLRLPASYFELLSELQSTQARVTLGQSGEMDNEKLRDIRIQLSDIENKAGLNLRNIPQRNETNLHKNSLRDIQTRLSDDEVLLSFSLSAGDSFLWAVTTDKVQLYELAGTKNIADTATRFAEAVRDGHDTSAAGQGLSRELFGQLPVSIRNKKGWLVTGDGELLDAFPFSALPDPGDTTVPIVKSHAIRLLPSELLLLAQKAKQPKPEFLGIGDPIYNLADSRRTAHIRPVQATQARASVALARLPGSEREIRSSARLSGMPESQILMGAQANGAALRTALMTHPAIVHFAVHVVSPEGQPQDAALALSLNHDDIPELLTREVIAEYRVPGSLVVLSGCFSEQGRILPGAGVIGLSRAWLLAGASAVVVTAWPTPDDSGQFFSAFYGHLNGIKVGTLAERASKALQLAQIDMQRESGYRSFPKFWAAYSIISKE
jgi:CHAT domain-containing protein